jgi:SAM-dependent methyltransferase
MVMGAETFSPIADPDDVDWPRIRRLTIVCVIEDSTAPDGVLVVLHRRDGRWQVPTGERRPGEDVWDDSVLRIPLETMGFRRQATHPFALDHEGRHVVFWVDGGRYDGTRMASASDAEWWSGSAWEAADLLRSQGDGSLARLVDLAAESRRTMSYERQAADSHRTLVGAYLGAATPQGASGFGGTEAEWRDGRGMLLDALDPSRPEITFLDHGCANGHLAVTFSQWAAERGVRVDPYGVDIAAELVDRARADHPDLAEHFWVGDALTWRHPEGSRFDLVHVLLDFVPPDRHAELVRHQVEQVVAPGGRLVVSQYGAVPASQSPEAVLTRLGHPVAGVTSPPMRNGRPRGFPSVWIEASPQ